MRGCLSAASGNRTAVVGCEPVRRSLHLAPRASPSGAESDADGLPFVCGFVAFHEADDHPPAPDSSPAKPQTGQGPDRSRVALGNNTGSIVSRYGASPVGTSGRARIDLVYQPDRQPV